MSPSSKEDAGSGVTSRAYGKLKRHIGGNGHGNVSVNGMSERNAGCGFLIATDGFEAAGYGFISANDCYRSANDGFLSSHGGFPPPDDGLFSARSGVLSAHDGSASARDGFGSAHYGFWSADIGYLFADDGFELLLFFDRVSGVTRILWWAGLEHRVFGMDRRCSPRQECRDSPRIFIRFRIGQWCRTTGFCRTGSGS